MITPLDLKTEKVFLSNHARIKNEYFSPSSRDEPCSQTKNVILGFDIYIALTIEVRKILQILEVRHCPQYLLIE